jgi:hypothetical protein
MKKKEKHILKKLLNLKYEDKIYDIIEKKIDIKKKYIKIYLKY